MKYISCILLLSLFLNAKAQNLQGKVTDDVTGSGIPFVSVGIVGTNIATVSNENGDFILKVNNYPAKIRVSHVSYLLVEMILSAPQDKLELRLKPASITLSEVTVDPFKGQRIVRTALEKAKGAAAINFYAKAFYRQLTTVNQQASQIYELFYDLQWNTRRVEGWVAKQSRFAELSSPLSFSINNQSYLTFLYSGYLLPEKNGKFVNLTSLNDYQIVIDKYIEQADQKIAVITCKYKNGKKNLYYVNSTYYIGLDDFKIYRLVNSVFNLPMKFSEASPKFPPIITTISTFNGNNSPIPVLESVATKAFFNLNAKGQQISSNISSLLTVYEVDDNLKNQPYTILDRKVKDKNVIASIKYDAEFWKDNPIVKQTTLEDSFIRMMESKSAFGTMTNQ